MVEVLVATGVWIVLGGTLLYLTQGLLGDAKLIAARQSDYIELTHLLETWESEAASALAIFVPSKDVLGSDNADGHELDFYSRDASRAGHFWAYRWDSRSHVLQRYTYSVPGTAATPSDPPITGITEFAAARKFASTVAQPFLAGYIPRDVLVNFGYPEVSGGNAIADVTVGDARNRFEIELLPGTMVSGFQVIVGTFAPTATPAPSPTPATPTPSPTASPTRSPAPTAAPTATTTTRPTPAPTPTPCYAVFPITLTFFGLTWWEGQQTGNPCSGFVTSVAFVFANFPAVDMVPLAEAFMAIPHPGLAVGYFVQLQDLSALSAQVWPGSYVSAGDTIAAAAALPCKYIFYSNPATIQVLIGYGGYPIATDDSAIGSIVANLQEAIPGCVPVE